MLATPKPSKTTSTFTGAAAEGQRLVTKATCSQATSVWALALQPSAPRVPSRALTVRLCWTTSTTRLLVARAQPKSVLAVELRQAPPCSPPRQTAASPSPRQHLKVPSKTGADQCARATEGKRVPTLAARLPWRSLNNTRSFKTESLAQKQRGAVRPQRNPPCVYTKYAERG
jgi:hypothetical protein